jgi:hypothetical protein
MTIKGFDTHTTPEFRAALQAMAARHGWDWQAIATVMASETVGTFSPSIRNPESGATGLIQFMPSTAANLGTTVAALATMTQTAQLAYVERYFKGVFTSHPTNAPLRRVDYYLAVFWPAAIGAPMDHKITEFPSSAYRANKNAFDPEHKGYITVADLDYMLRAWGGEHVEKKKSPAAGQQGSSS